MGIDCLYNQIGIMRSVNYMKRGSMILVCCIIFFSVMVSVLLMAAKDNKAKVSTAINYSSEIDKITVKITKTSKLATGIGYAIELENGSRNLLKQNTVYLGYRLKTKNGFRHNDFKVEVKGNKVDIKPNEKVILNVFVSKEYIDMSALEIDKPNLEINGYLNEVKAENHFMRSQG
jgi:uncharacterized protein YpmS